jgi:hypothetical protein
MSLKDKLKNLKEKAKKIPGYVIIATGTAATATIGWTGLQWPKEIKFDPATAREKLVIDLSHDSPGVVAVVGDTGLDSPQRRAILGDLKALCLEAQAKKKPFRIVTPGDPAYPSGPNNDAEFEQHVRPFENLCPAHKGTFHADGNHTHLKVIGQGYMSERLHGKNGSTGTVKLNYYYAVVFEKELWVFNDTTAYDAWIDPGIEGRQEAFTRWAGEKYSGLIFVYFGHHPFFSTDKRNPSGDLMDFYWKLLSLYADVVYSGHLHAVEFNGCMGHRQVCHWLSGAGAKLTKGRVGYLVREDGETRFRYVDTAPTLAPEDDE